MPKQHKRKHERPERKPHKRNTTGVVARVAKALLPAAKSRGAS
jgi:hypothetical protein